MIGSITRALLLDLLHSGAGQGGAKGSCGSGTGGIAPPMDQQVVLIALAGLAGLAGGFNC